IYTASKFGVILQRPVIYHGLFGSGFFQMLYTPEPASLLMFCTSLEYHVLITLPLLVLSVSIYPLLPVALASLSISLAIFAVAASIVTHFSTRSSPNWKRKAGSTKRTRAGMITTWRFLGAAGAVCA